MRDQAAFKSSPHYSGLLEALPGGIVVVSSELSVLFANRQAVCILGDHWQESPSGAGLLRQCGEAIARGAPCSCEHIAGDDRVFHVNIRPMPGSGAVMHFGDTGEHSSEHLRMIQSVTGVGTWEQCLATGELVWSKEMYSIVGLPYSDEKPMLRIWRERIHPADLDRTDREFEAVVAGGEVLDSEFRIVQPHGEVRWVLARARIVRNSRGEPVRAVGLTLDITDRKRVSETLRELEERYRLAAEAGRIGLWDWHINMNHVIWSDRIYQFHGLEPGTFGGTVEDFKALVHPEDRNRVTSAIEDSLIGGRKYEVEFRIIRPNGEIRWMATRARVIYDVFGKPVRMLGASQDITDRRRAEEALRRSHAELERFAFVASHDLQEPLRAVKSYSQLLVRRLARPDDEQSKRYADFIAGGIDRMEMLIQDLLTWSRAVHDDEPLPQEPVDLSQCVAEALRSLEAGLTESGAVVRCGALPVVPGDRMQMTQVFQNLLSNSLKYRRAGVVPEISIDGRQEGHEYILEIRDNGIGFAPEYSDRIFGLFKRLHRNEYPGSGLGLAICKRIVERHEGRIWAVGEPDRGAKFFIALPAGRLL